MGGLEQRSDIAPFREQLGLGLRQHVVGKVREAVGAIHPLPPVLALPLQGDRLAVLAEHPVEILLRGSEGRVARLDMRDPLGGGESLLCDLVRPGQPALVVRRQGSERCDVDARRGDEALVRRAAAVPTRVARAGATGRAREEEQRNNADSPQVEGVIGFGAMALYHSNREPWSGDFLQLLALQPKMSDLYAPTRRMPSDS